jgi:hypothetical protein
LKRPSNVKSKPNRRRSARLERKRLVKSQDGKKLSSS